ncbi:hypothetical protein EAH_00014910 [Eimeria acervulina]|uniref:Uncharacterized protein n=1 Tax=Eimeria acervulina TaxID=5801 RepID=U6GP54_EIMAC|nr:hypothetical protein EAH_00014910 [Eimeria acervulina]CDI80399.1 hypothetical protein EAH_00014910 [Eimeria acervulina]
MTVVYSLSRYFSRRHHLAEFEARNVGDRIPRPTPRPEGGGASEIEMAERSSKDRQDSSKGLSSFIESGLSLSVAVSFSVSLSVL